MHGHDRVQPGTAPSPNEHLLMVELLEIALDRLPTAQLLPPDALPVPVSVVPELDPVPEADPVPVLVPVPVVPVGSVGAAAPAGVPVAGSAGVAAPCGVEVSVPLSFEPVELWVEPVPFVLVDVVAPAVPP